MDELALLKQQAAVFKALSNVARLRIVVQLSRGEQTVTQLTKMSGLDQSTVSKHLSVLRSQGIVDDTRHGNNVYYRLTMPCVMDFFGCARQVIDERRG
ncbi:MAG: winged helix-turn-helix transcriptional regulator [Candidatus Riflebacteria bacterium]|nr:winged helix-turn-helix transcriptional regulator [Candidatus Riflebacteria bacterium]